MAVWRYPYNGAAHYVTVPNPELDNILHINLRTTIAKLSNGDIITYKHDPHILRLRMVFHNLEGSVLTDIEAFFKATAGLEVGYIDHEATAWRGYIVTAPPDIEYIKDGACKRGNVDIEFEGTEV